MDTLKLTLSDFTFFRIIYDAQATFLIFMNKLHIFIISWAGQHENAIRIATQMKDVYEKVCIVYSDPNSDWQLEAPCEIIRRPNELFWGDKFKACIDGCNQDPILVIHADCTYPDWSHLAKRAQEMTHHLPMIGVWSPSIDFVPWNIKTMQIAMLTEFGLSVVTRTDAIVFYLSPIIIERMRGISYEENLYGWGIEWMAACVGYARGMIAVIDNTIQVHHPQSDGTSYPRDQAQRQLEIFLTQLSVTEEVQGILLRAKIAQNGGHIIKQ
ncbi:hypothetical protein A4F89_01930 [Polynucleobacter asymbioticus]|uniref:Glycosyltransferase n=2 Tax=Polynucleobacter asymbioticus TaxID=576611 RepID=A0AAC9IX58_9BURK|nr:hypothetical protein A4F89_01930 [Polynucleobacter asymbioticus]APC00467.1 hypothetical protein AOC25_01935 [Polynucleobacter asymbioticus]